MADISGRVDLYEAVEINAERNSRWRQRLADEAYRRRLAADTYGRALKRRRFVVLVVKLAMLALIGAGLWMAVSP